MIIVQRVPRETSAMRIAKRKNGPFGGKEAPSEKAGEAKWSRRDCSTSPGLRVTTVVH
jgi:hypothetical protein